ncbi:hypothetical protein V8C86DRAFT_3133444 [Haematococcus lacustris]
MLACRLRPCPRKDCARIAANTRARVRVSVQVTCPDASLLAVVKAHPSVVKRGEVTLECDNGGLAVLRGLSLQQLQQVLPVVHKHKFPELLQYVESRLVTKLASTWSLDPAAPGYIIKWLVTAEQLQLDALKQAALEGLNLSSDIGAGRNSRQPPSTAPSAAAAAAAMWPGWQKDGVVKAHPSGVKRGGVTLKCDDGELAVLRDVFVVSSPWMADLMGEGCTSVKVSGSTKEEWLLVISQLYPIIPRPEPSLQQVQQVLPVVHKHNFPELLQYVNGRLVNELPRTWSLKPTAPGYIINWLVTAEQLQLDALKQAALEGLKKQSCRRIRGLMNYNKLDADLLRLSDGLCRERKCIVEVLRNGVVDSLGSKGAQLVLFL